MTTYDWHQLRARAIELFAGDTPGADLEQRILEHFTETPARVQQLVEAIGRRVTDGKVRSGWAVLRRELDTKPADDTIRVTDDEERANQLRLAEAWIRNAGGYFDRQTELEDELFGDLGRLHTWRNEPQPRERITRVWTDERPRFEAAEHEQIERLAEQARKQREIRQLLKRATVKDMPDTQPDKADADIDWSTP